MQAGHPLHFTQVTPGTDLNAILWRWAGSFTVEGPTLHGTAVARFIDKKVGLCKRAGSLEKGAALLCKCSCKACMDNEQTLGCF